MGNSWSDAVYMSGDLPSYDGVDEVLTDSPYSGDYRGATWNTQALFAASCRKQFPKRRLARKLIHQHDFVCLQETHGQEGKTLAFNLPDGHVAFWSNGSTRQAGVGIVLKHDFLKKFNPIQISRTVR